MKTLDQEVLQLLFDRSTELICVLDSNKFIIDFNNSFFELIGYRHEDLKNFSFLQIIHPEDLKFFLNTIQDASANFNEANEVRVISKKGQTCWMSFKFFKNDKNIVFFGKDITFQKEYQFETFEHEQKLRMLLSSGSVGLEELGNREMANSMPQIVWTALPDGSIDFYNDRWYQFNGFKKGQWSDEGRKQVIHPDDYSRWLQTWQQALRVTESYAIEYRFKDKYGDYRWFLGRAIPSKDSSGQVKKWYGTCTDIHDQKLAQAERETLLVTAQAAEEASKLKSQFVANMSHEIRTPLNGILGMVQIMQQSGLSTELTEYVQILTESSNHLRSVVNDILDLSKIESNQLHLDMNKFDLRALSKSVYASLKMSAKHKNIGFRFHIPRQESLNLIGDSIRIKQVLINLVQNAIKFTSHGYVEVRIKIRGEGKKAEMSVEVEDTGIGIAEEYISNIFVPFTQADNTITRKFGGTGLGLSICQNLVQMMRGKIFVQSILGKGSVFTFNIPVERADFNVLGNKTEIFQLKSKNNFHILVAEDNEINQKVIRQALKHFGHTCDVSNDGGEAVNMHIRNNYDLILMDYHMPKMDGLTAIKKIRSLGANKCNIPIVALTADAFEETRNHCIAAGANEYISKPIEWNALFTVIETLGERASQIIDIKIRDGLRAQVQPDGFKFVRDISNEYCINTESRIEQLARALSENDFEKGFHLAHTIKSSSGQLGAVAMQSAAGQLEIAFKSKNKSSAQAIYFKMKMIFTETVKAFQSDY